MASVPFCFRSQGGTWEVAARGEATSLSSSLLVLEVTLPGGSSSSSVLGDCPEVWFGSGGPSPSLDRWIASCTRVRNLDCMNSVSAGGGGGQRDEGF